MKQWTYAMVVVGLGCAATVETSASPCQAAADHLAACVDATPATVTSCDQAEAEALLAQDCEALAADKGSWDVCDIWGVGWLFCADDSDVVLATPNLDAAETKSWLGSGVAFGGPDGGTTIDSCTFSDRTRNDDHVEVRLTCSPERSSFGGFNVFERLIRLYEDGRAVDALDSRASEGDYAVHTSSDGTVSMEINIDWGWVLMLDNDTHGG